MQALELADRHLGGAPDRPPVVLLHGLLGSSRNWQSAGRILAETFQVHALDLRNHGDSPHDDRMDYPSMAQDVLATMDRLELPRVHLVGHSMGGKVAMYLACRYPDRVASLTVVDIAPREYPPRWEKEFAALQSMPVKTLERRVQAEEWLEPDVSDWAFRKFLVSNLERNPEGGFRWMVNLDILQASLPNLFIQVPPDGWRFDGPVLFLRGSQSRFIQDKDTSMIRRLFPFSEVKTVGNAGHNVHFDQSAAFAEAVRAHIEESDA